MLKPCLLAILLATPTLCLQFSQDLVVKGNEDGLNYTVIQFRVSQTSEDGEWTCLRAEFSLDIALQLESNGYMNYVTSNTTVNKNESNCSQLVLKLQPDSDELVRLLFEQDKSQKEGQDVDIFYMKKVQVEGIQFAGTNTSVNADFEYIPEGKKIVNATYDQSPVELETHNSFKCYKGFSLIGNNTDENHRKTDGGVELSFSKFRLEMYAEFDKRATDMNMKSPWKRIYSCDADISTILPIIVGCALGGIVLLTLVGYIIAKKRSSHAYEEL